MKTVRLPATNTEGLNALGPFLAGKLYEVPDDVAPLLDPRIAADNLRRDGNGNAIEAITPLTEKHREAFEHLRALANPPKKVEEADKAPEPEATPEPAKSAKSTTPVSN